MPVKPKIDKFVQHAIKHPHALHKELGIPNDQHIPLDRLQEAAKAKGVLGERARLALTLRGMHR